MTSATQASAHAVANETPGNGTCQFCERKGLPILPVRYAVCQRNDRNADIPELETSRIQEFTDIMLDKTLVGGEEQGRTVPDEVKAEITQSTGSQVNKYILRQLREGYLYFYDQDNPNGQHWYAYAITSDGKYYQFPVLQPPALDEIVFPERCQSNPGDVLSASVVTLPFPEDSGTLYYAFSEHPWPEPHIRMIGNHLDWRNTHMQQVDISAWVDGQQQPFAFGTDELEKVAEYSEAAKSLGEQFWSSGPKRALYEPEKLREVMSQRLDHAASEYQGKGLILAVKDEIGIIDELNAYRHQALAEVENFVCESDGNRRKLLCKQAIDAFKENFAKNYVASQKKSLDDAVDSARAERDDFLEQGQSQVDSSPRSRAQHQRKYDQLNRAVRDAELDRDNFKLNLQSEAAEQASERRRLQSEIERLKQEQAERLAELDRRAASDDPAVARSAEAMRRDPFYDNEIQRNELLLHNTRSEAERMADRHAAQLDELYDSDALEKFAEQHRKRTRMCEPLLALHDGDYSLWVKHHLLDVIGRYSQSDYWMGLGLSGLLANTLRGGILAPPSGELWQFLARAMMEKRAIIISGLFANNAELMGQARDTVSSLSDSDHLSADTLVGWSERFQTQQAAALTLHGRTPSANDIINRVHPILGQFSNTVGNAVAALVTQDLIADSDGQNKRFLRQFIRLGQLAWMSDPDTQQYKAPLPQLVDVKMTMAQYAHWLQQINQRYQDNQANKGADTDLAMPSLTGGGGNFSAPMAENGVVVTTTIPCFGLDPAVVQRLTENSAPGESYDAEQTQQQWADVIQSARDVAGTIAGAGNYGKLLALGLTAWNLLLAVDQELLDDENSGADWNRLVSSGVGLLSASMGAAEGYQAIRVASMGPGTEGALGRLLSGDTWKLGSGLLSVASGMLSVWDGMRKLTESSRARRLGQSLTADNLKVLGGFGVVSGISTILVIGFGVVAGLAVGLFFGILTLLLGVWIVTLVAPSVQMWVDRSLVGFHTSQVQKFEDLASEQSSLEMVFQGVVVELSWSPVRPDANQYVKSPYDIDVDGLNKAVESASQQVGVNLSIEIPETPSVSLILELLNVNANETVFKWSYEKQASDEGLVSKSERSTTMQTSAHPEFSLKDGFFYMEYYKEYTKEVLSDTAELKIFFSSSGGVYKRDTFRVEIE
ncbi:T6SS effector BTH_I2691 family protein [Salinicola rhizosphaerae]|uniref:Toxin VasX N-terminal region domain-containing protein n=1 Tax=Salinicola rhizosphaerae TaxID=1443141 RepID=A0ABQ3EEA4_9GAMM|nr:T6SS effector BTH_I2691 family protein [Salinicola rhizosphaerae]GHB31342.1 hypothetical protein GCM10009038_32800 [Salinicola rhizosphaerae]